MYFCLGEHCHLEDKCYRTGNNWRNPCGEGNECHTDFSNGKTICRCQTGLTGESCQKDVDECLPEYPNQPPPCAHGGTCVNTHGTFYCLCAKGYTGDYCDINIDECATNPCYNGGTCMDAVGDFDCSCTEGNFYNKSNFKRRI